MELIFEKESSDARGKIIFLKYGQKSLNIVEIKKGFSRGGHYHTFETKHYVLSGVIEYREKNIETNRENTQIFSTPITITVPPITAHLLTALEDTIFAEAFEQDYSAVECPEYRNTVTQKMS